MLASMHHELREPREEQGESEQALADPRQHGIVASPANTRIAASLVFSCFLAFPFMFSKRRWNWDASSPSSATTI
jgi:hypothetical protein